MRQVVLRDFWRYLPLNWTVNMDTTLQVAWISVLIALIGLVGTIATTLLNGRNERENSADISHKETLKRQILLLDSHVNILRYENEQKDREIERLREQLDEGLTHD